MLLRMRPAIAFVLSATLAGCIATADPANTAKPPVYDNRMPSQMPNQNIYSPRSDANPNALPDPNAPQQVSTQMRPRGGPLVAGPGYPDGVPAHIMAGSWRLSDGGRLCIINLSQERAGRGYTAQGQQGCSEEFFGLRSWEMSDNELVLRNNMGEVTARLVPVAANRFDGKSSRGIPVMLAR